MCSQFPESVSSVVNMKNLTASSALSKFEDTDSRKCQDMFLKGYLWK
jgi:hypothetical protein